MKNTKKIVLVGGVFLALALIAGYFLLSKGSVAPKLSDEFMTEQDLLDKSALVVEVEVKATNEQFTYSDAQFQISEVHILSVLNDPDFEVGNELRILETITDLNEEYPLLVPNKQYILFLYEYSGPVTDEDCYIISGTNLGSILIEADEVKLNERQTKAFDYLKVNGSKELKTQIGDYFVKK